MDSLIGAEPHGVAIANGRQANARHASGHDAPCMDGTHVANPDDSEADVAGSCRIHGGCYIAHRPHFSSASAKLDRFVTNPAR